MTRFWRPFVGSLLFIVAVYGGSIAVAAAQHGARLLWLFPATISVCAGIGSVLVWIGGQHDPY